MANETKAVVAAAAVVAGMRGQVVSDVDWLRRHLLAVLDREGDGEGDDRSTGEVVAAAVEEYGAGRWPERAAMAFGSVLEAYDERLEAQLGALAELGLVGVALVVAAVREWSERECEHEWAELAGEPPVDVCVQCGTQRA